MDDFRDHFHPVHGMNGRTVEGDMTMKRGYQLLGLGLAAVLASCSQDSSSSDLPDDLLSTDADFIMVPRTSLEAVTTARAALGNGPVALQDGDNNFYLAIRKDSLAQRWFLSAFTKQWFPGDVNAFADFTL